MRIKIIKIILGVPIVASIVAGQASLAQSASHPAATKRKQNIQATLAQNIRQPAGKTGGLDWDAIRRYRIWVVVSRYTARLKKNPRDAEAFFDRGILLSELGLFKKANADYTAALRLTPRRPGLIHYNRAINYTRLKQFRLALADYTQAIKILRHKKNKIRLCDSYSNRGLIYGLLEMYDKAMDDYQAAIRNCPSSIRPLWNRAFLYRDLKKYHLALADFTRAIDMGAGYFAYLYRGWIYFDTKRFKKALADFVTAGASHPERIFAHLETMFCWQALGDYRQAMADINTVLAYHDPALAFAYVMRSLDYLALNPATRPGRYDYMWPLLDKRFDFIWWEILRLDSISKRYP